MENVLQNCSNLAKAEVPSSVQKAKNIISAISVSSAEAERGFSKMNIIYSDKRSRLTVENVANLMIINLSRQVRLLCPWARHLTGCPRLYVEDRWPINLEKGNSQASADVPSKV